MNGKTRGWILGSVTFLVICAVAIGGAKAQSGGAPPATTTPAPKKAEEQFKNIQTLKGIPADQLIPAMQFITASLGVECEFCHVQGAFEKDDKKPKQTARKMMEMMFAINKDNFEGHREVTCYSCHRGSADPVATPVVMAEEPKPVMAEAKKEEEKKVEPKKAETTTVEEKERPAKKGEEKEDEEEAAKAAAAESPADVLFDRYLQAAGGSAVATITSRVMKGTISFGDRNVPIEIFAKDPGKRISFTHTPDGDSVTAFNGHEGWLGAPGRPLREMHGSDLNGAAMDADLHFASHLKGSFSEVQVQGTEKVGGHDTYAVVGRREGKPPLRLYFDEESGLLVRLVRYGETPLGLLPTQIDYADYRAVGWVKIPFRWTLARPGGRFTIQLSDVKQNVPLDDAKFAKPPAPPEEQKGPAK
jgi:outer membrane lipoprotein-sorting protein